MSIDSLQLTPLMRQYHDIKARFPEALLLFQVGDFYELFYNDAKQAAACLGIALTARGTNSTGEPIPLCGVPVHVIDQYLIKLVRAGFHVVLCDQVTKPQAGKLIERRVSQVLTPGTLTEITMLQDKSASYLAALVPHTQGVGIALVELLTGQVLVTLLADHDERLLEAELARFLPDEVVLPVDKLGARFAQLVKKMGYVVTEFTAARPDEVFTAWLAATATDQVRVIFERSDLAREALALLHGYLAKNCATALVYCKQIILYQSADFLLIDAATQRNLELFKNSVDGSDAHTLFRVLDTAMTPMGSRQIQKWLLRPLVSREFIEQRLEVVAFLVTAVTIRRDLRERIQGLGDLERVVGRIALGRAQLAEYLSLLRALHVVPQIIELLRGVQVPLMTLLCAKLHVDEALVTLLERALYDEGVHEWRVRAQYDAELDRLRALAAAGTTAIVQLEQKEQEATGISSLKIRYNKVHGYGIEITKTHLALVPAHYMRVQTLANRERYTTQELRDLEYDMARAQAASLELEDELFAGVAAAVYAAVPLLKRMASALAHIDALAAFAECAYMHRYVRPQFTESRDITILEGRHPIVELAMQSFIPNDTALTEEQHIWLITGPNMGGKSTYLRQVALTVLMAQAGSFVPARSAMLPIIDRIFTRLGAADKMAEGKSTFLVEMEEAALICTRATKNSLVILDEVGRGTSTYDGLALAQAIVEHIYHTVGARCLFATHYHELTALTKECPGIVAYHAASKETAEGLLLLHKIMPGAAAGSFGLEAARRAGLPPAILARAAELLGATSVRPAVVVVPPAQDKLAPACACMQLADLDLDAITPRQAFDILCKLKAVF